MAPPDAPERSVTEEALNVGKVTRLATHLARSDTAALSQLLDPSIMGLLSRLGADVTSPMGLAYFVVNVHGEREALRRQDVRTLLLSKLEGAEATELCELLQLPVITPLRTLRAIDFNAAPQYFEHLDRWYGVEVVGPQEGGSSSEGSQRALASHRLHNHQLQAFRKLRRTIERPPASVLVHMPFGAGKLRLVATAALDLYRSEPDDRSIVWLAPGAAMCEDAFMELQQVWHQLGSRDITIHQLYGDRPTRDLDQLGGSIAIIDIHRLSKDDSALATLGSFTSVAILADAENRVHPVGKEIIEAMSAGGAFSVVGLLATPGAAVPEGPVRTSLKQAFPDASITIEPGHDLELLRITGDFRAIDGLVVNLMSSSGTSLLESAPPALVDASSLDVDPAYASELADNVERNERLLEILEREGNGPGHVVFYATTAKQARLFAGLLLVHGVKAMAITSEASAAARDLALQRFVGRYGKVLCLHGFQLVGSANENISISACVMAAPTKSRAAMISTIGRLVQGRAPNQPPLKLIVTADSQADAGWVEALNTWSTLNT